MVLGVSACAADPGVKVRTSIQIKQQYFFQDGKLIGKGEILERNTTIYKDRQATEEESKALKDKPE